MDANVGVSGPDEVSPTSPDLELLLILIPPLMPRPMDDAPATAPLPPGGGLFVDGDLAIILLLPPLPAVLLAPAPLPPPQAGLPAVRVDDDGVVVPPPALQEGLLVLVGGGVAPAVPVPLLDGCNLLGLGDSDPVDLIEGEAPAPAPAADGILLVVEVDLVGVVNLDDAPAPAAVVAAEVLLEREATRGTLLGVVVDVGEDLNDEEDDDKLLLPPAPTDGTLAELLLVILFVAVPVVLSLLVGVLDLLASMATLGRPL
jgi:hypothetical protein